jgi:hypothetical protein
MTHTVDFFWGIAHRIDFFRGITHGVGFSLTPPGEPGENVDTRLRFPPAFDRQVE